MTAYFRSQLSSVFSPLDDKDESVHVETICISPWIHHLSFIGDNKPKKRKHSSFASSYHQLFFTDSVSSSSVFISAGVLNVIYANEDENKLSDPSFRFCRSLEEVLNVSVEEFVEKKVDFALMYEIVDIEKLK